MDASDGQVNRDAASVYEEFFVPALFAEWAPKLADALEPMPQGLVLDVACGTGVLGRELARRLGPGRVCGVDRNEGMLAVARGILPDVDWRVGRAEELPFESESCAAVGSQFGLMFFEDRAKALSEMWRVLAPGGRLAVAVWGPLGDMPGYQALVDLLASSFGEHIASELRAPFCLGDAALLRDLFEDAGVPEPTIATAAGTARFPSIDAWICTEVKGWTLADHFDDQRLSRLKHESSRALAGFALNDGRVEFASRVRIAAAQKRE